MNTILLHNATIVTQNRHRDVIKGDVLIGGNKILEVGVISKKADITYDCTHKLIIPGLIQTHVHLIQTLFRNQADDLSLIDWLTKRIYLLESFHTKESVYWSGMLTCSEMLSGGTTCVVDMGTVNHEESSLNALCDSGIRGYSGKLLMDKGGSAPEALLEDKDKVIKDTVTLLDKWHGAENGMIHYLLAPRFALSCTDELLEEISMLSAERDILIHTHASENREEVRRVRERSGLGNIEFLKERGMMKGRLLLAHCVWASDHELDILKETNSTVLHCPHANLKLASGIAPVPAMIDKGINVTLGSDGAPCNNTIDMFNEMRSCALLHKAVSYDPTVVPASTVFDMATCNAARALGREGELGVIAPGAKADIAVIDCLSPHMVPFSDPISMLVYCARASDVSMTFVEGRLLYDKGEFTSLDIDKILNESTHHCKSILNKIDLGL